MIMMKEMETKTTDVLLTYFCRLRVPTVMCKVTAMFCSSSAMISRPLCSGIMMATMSPVPAHTRQTAAGQTGCASFNQFIFMHTGPFVTHRTSTVPSPDENNACSSRAEAAHPAPCATTLKTWQLAGVTLEPFRQQTCLPLSYKRDRCTSGDIPTICCTTQWRKTKSANRGL